MLASRRAAGRAEKGLSLPWARCEAETGLLSGISSVVLWWPWAGPACSVKALVSWGMSGKDFKYLDEYLA